MAVSLQFLISEWIRQHQYKYLEKASFISLKKFEKIETHDYSFLAWIHIEL